MKLVFLAFTSALLAYLVGMSALLVACSDANESSPSPALDRIPAGDFRIGTKRLQELPTVQVGPEVLRHRDRPSPSQSSVDTKPATTLELPADPLRLRAGGPSGYLLAPATEEYFLGLETREHTLWIGRGSEPRLYTVTTGSGAILAEGIGIDELEQRFPEFTGFERLGETDLIDHDD